MQEVGHRDGNGRREALPAALFTEPFRLAETDGSGNNRDGLRRALALLREAGWQVRDRKLVNAAGQPMSFTILLSDPSLERLALPYSQSLQRLGVEASVRTVDPAQYQRLMEEFDYDVTTDIMPGADLPGNELRDALTCAGRDATGSSNAAGICEPVIDALVDRIVKAEDRASLATAGQALDRVLLSRWYMVPQYHNRIFRLAVWDRFGRPEAKVRNGFVLDSWWVDPERAARTDAARRAGN